MCFYLIQEVEYAGRIRRKDEIMVLQSNGRSHTHTFIHIKGALWTTVDHTFVYNICVCMHKANTMGTQS